MWNDRRMLVAIGRPELRRRMMRSGEWMSRRAAAVLLGMIVVGASALAIRWAFLVPVFQGPDEATHLDYALAIRDGGRLFKAQPLDVKKVVYVHPWTSYLLD